MDVYLVGGAVRDELLGIPVTERDWVVVGSSPEEMEAQGYKAVGKDFPVFLHPQSKEEYALARTERKKGRGYRGFEIHASAAVTLEEDLMRRDLTINAMAKNNNGEIIDPYGGRRDLKSGVLRHVSAAFDEDPLRVVRVARFAAKLHQLGFSIAQDTHQLMRHIVSTREILELSPERIWRETQKALTAPSPEQFFLVLHRVNALSQTHPNINDEFSNLRSQKLGLAALHNIAGDENDTCMRLAAFIGGLYFHQREQGCQDVRELCAKLILPKACKEMLLLVVSLQHQCHRALELDEKELLILLRSIDVKRKPERFTSLLRVFTAIHQVENNTSKYPQANYLQNAAAELDNISIDTWIEAKIGSEELANNIKNAQLALLKKLIQDKNA